MILMNKDLMRPYFISTRVDCMSIWESKDEQSCSLKQLEDRVGGLSEPGKLASFEK